MPSLMTTPKTCLQWVSPKASPGSSSASAEEEPGIEVTFWSVSDQSPLLGASAIDPTPDDSSCTHVADRLPSFA
jgi:hypothetical protein